jgi:hypothetical protein
LPTSNRASEGTLCKNPKPSFKRAAQSRNWYSCTGNKVLTSCNSTSLSWTLEDWHKLLITINFITLAQRFMSIDTVFYSLWLGESQFSMFWKLPCLSKCVLCIASVGHWRGQNRF